MRWQISHRADPRAAVIADRHYSRQTVGAAQFVPPGRCLVLVIPGAAYWVTSWPFAQFVRHRWGGAWICSAFRNERRDLFLSSELIAEALAATRWFWGDPPAPHGMVTFVDAGRVKAKRDPGRCYRRAGFIATVPPTTEGGLIALHLPPLLFPAACPPLGAQERLFG